MKVTRPYLDFNLISPKCTKLLIMVTNELITYRNQVVESTINFSTLEVPDKEDQDWISELDRIIDTVEKYLGQS